MTALYEETRELHDTAEVHWSTGTILAIFFAAALISAVFFGLGYSFGGEGIASYSTAKTSAAAATNTPTIPSPPKRSTQVASASGMATPVAEDILPARNHSAASDFHAKTRPMPVARTARPALIPAHKTIAPAPAATRASAAISSGKRAATMVQVGAIGDRKDAERLVLQLRKKGFHAGIYPSKRDKFLHVQIGPFASPQQAQSMRHRVIASGYHAILKRPS